MSRYGLYYLLKYHSNTVHRLISRFFNDRPVIIKDEKYYIYGRKDQRISWIYHGAHIHIYINKNRTYCYNAKAIGVYVYDIIICALIYKGEFLIIDNKEKLPHQIRGAYSIISHDPIRAIRDLYHHLVRSENWIYTRELMNKNNIKYK
jgi:hypothetical protein